MKRILSVIFAAGLIFAGCASQKKANPMAMATLAPTANQTAKGMVHFMERNDGSVDVDVDLSNVPAGVHGFHIHDKGDCGDNGNAAGRHFDPTSAQHGAPTAPSHHAGDFGNVTADSSSNVKPKFNTLATTVSTSSSSAVGRP